VATTTLVFEVSSQRRVQWLQNLPIPERKANEFPAPKSKHFQVVFNFVSAAQPAPSGLHSV